MHLAADRRSATVVASPRDSMVPVPGCTDPNAVLAGAPVRRLNSAFTLGGAGSTVKAVEANTGVRIDHFTVRNFEGFQAMVDALGGVDVCLPRPVNDRQSRLDLPAGTSHVAGEQALAFVGVRHGICDGSDLGRIRRQQAFLSAVVREATSTSLLLRRTGWSASWTPPPAPSRPTRTGRASGR
jgi:LCP family protein required for cell wall assembly